MQYHARPPTFSNRSSRYTPRLWLGYIYCQLLILCALYMHCTHSTLAPLPPHYCREGGFVTTLDESISVGNTVVILQSLPCLWFRCETRSCSQYMHTSCQQRFGRKAHGLPRIIPPAMRRYTAVPHIMTFTKNTSIGLTTPIHQDAAMLCLHQTVVECC